MNTVSPRTHHHHVHPVAMLRADRVVYLYIAGR